MPHGPSNADDHYPSSSSLYGHPGQPSSPPPPRGQATMRLLPPTNRSNASSSPERNLHGGRRDSYLFDDDDVEEYGAESSFSPVAPEYVFNSSMSSKPQKSSSLAPPPSSSLSSSYPLPPGEDGDYGDDPMQDQAQLESAIAGMLGVAPSSSSSSKTSHPITPIRRAPQETAPPLRLKTPKPTARPPRPLFHDSSGPASPSRGLTLSLDPLFNDSNSKSTHGRTNTRTTNRNAYDPNQERQPLYHDNADYSIYPESRAGSSLGNIPYFPPTNYDQYSIRSGSPTRTWTPSRSPGRAPTASNVSYEPRDLNGRSRPGTPSSVRYGANTRRPLPTAPLFSEVSGGDAVSIDIDPNAENPFEESSSRRRSRHARYTSRASAKSYTTYSSGSTMVSEDADDMSKVNLDEDEDDDDDDYTASSVSDLYGPAPQGRQDRRGVRAAQMTRREVKLINGELVLECKIPTILHSFLPRRDDREFTHMRYTAVTCDPDDFVSNGYRLRQQIGNTTRETEILICVTMYNEDEVDFTRTMHGIMRNISYFCSRSKSRTWGKDGWQKIVVCIIADGRQKVHPRTLNALAALGVYQEGIAKNVVNQKEVQAHVYEYTSQVSLDPDMKFKGAEKGIVPCQMVFCLKEQNLKKLNSHRWLFNAFGKALQPNVCIMLDVGTRPAPTALYHLWKAFDQDSNVAGAAGEIKAGKGKRWKGLLNPLVASQNFEYKMSNILDKPIESVFGYITVLPGALSAYRYHALQNDETGHGPLSQYFKGEMLHGQDADVFTANMYLAEDRILCWELVAKRNERWVLKFVKSAVGETDVPDAVPEFISQRRRWLNGAFFAAVYALLHCRQIWRTDHTFGRKLLLNVEFVYQFVQLVFTFFSLANFYLTFFFIAGALTDPKQDPFGHHIGKYIFVVLRYACILLICLQFILSMGNRPQGAKRMFTTGMVILAFIMAYTTFAALYMVVTQLVNTGNATSSSMFVNVVVSMLSTIGLYFFMSFLYLDPWHMFTSSAQYFALLPSYLCTLQIYAFCNTHDISWGTKGDNANARDLGTARGTGQSTVELEMPSEQLDIDSCYDQALRNLRDHVEVPQPSISPQQKQEDYYRAVRTYMVSIWLIANAILAMSVSEAYGTESAGNNGYLAFILWAVAALAAFRAIGSTAFLVLLLIHKLAEGRRKFAAANGVGLNGYIEPSAVSATTMSTKPLPHRNFLEYTRDSWTEAGWWFKRQTEKLKFWR